MPDVHDHCALESFRLALKNSFMLLATNDSIVFSSRDRQESFLMRLVAADNRVKALWTFPSDTAFAREMTSVT